MIGASGVWTGDGYPGVAPAVRLISLKVLDAKGVGYTSAVIAAIDWAIANKTAFGIDIINLSLGHVILQPAESDPLVQAVEAAVRAGIVVITAAGNNGCYAKPNQPEAPPNTCNVGYAGVTSPGNAASAITVGTVDTDGTAERSDDRVTRYSSRGPTWFDGLAKPDLVAPGHDLISSGDVKTQIHRNYESTRVKSKLSRRIARLGGTSMSAAVTSGVVALMIQAHREASLSHDTYLPGVVSLTPNAIKAILQFTAIPVTDNDGAEYDVLTQGAGGVNGGGALDLAYAINSRATFGIAWLRSGVESSITIEGETWVWPQTLIWGRQRIFGQMLYFNDPAWAADTVWGDLAVRPGDIQPRQSEDVVGGMDAHWTHDVVWGDGFITPDATDAQKIVWGYSRRRFWNR